MIIPYIWSYISMDILESTNGNFMNKKFVKSTDKIFLKLL